MLQKPTYETLGPIVLSRSLEDSSKAKILGIYCGNSSRTEVIRNSFSIKHWILSQKHNTQNCIYWAYNEYMDSAHDFNQDLVSFISGQWFMIKVKGSNMMKWTVPGGSVRPGQSVVRLKQASLSRPRFKNQFNIGGRRCLPCQILSWQEQMKYLNLFKINKTKYTRKCHFKYS